jgi:hypothetical protein
MRQERRAKRKIHNLVKFREWAKINIEENLDIKLSATHNDSGEANRNVSNTIVSVLHNFGYISQK